MLKTIAKRLLRCAFRNNLAKAWPLISTASRTDCIIHVRGGLGNQMFQYAFALAYAARHGTRKVKVDPFGADHNGYELDKVFNLDPRIRRIHILTWRALWLFDKRDRIVLDEGDRLSYQPSLLATNHSGIIQGFFPSYRYFSDCHDLVRKCFSFRNISFVNESLRSAILTSNSVAVHVRRGDYLHPSVAPTVGGICTTAYYESAIRFVKKLVPSPRFFVFSDDTSWCRRVFPGDDFIFVDGHSGESSWMDMYCMSLCRHSIIANSTFSWWGMWLGDQSRRICVGPERFSNPGHIEMNIEDFLPENVTRIGPEGNVTYLAECL